MSDKIWNQRGGGESKEMLSYEPSILKNPFAHKLGS